MFHANVRHSRLHGRRGLIAAAVAVACISAPVVQAVEVVPGGYSPEVDYGRGSLVVGSDGNVYRALGAVKAKDPVTAKDATWQLAHAAFDMTIDVPGRFDATDKAFTFIAGATISDTATVTVQLAPGTYDVKEPLTIGHSQGRRVVLKGAKDPAKCTLRFGQSDGLVVEGGTGLTIEGLSIQGTDAEHTGVVVEDRSLAVLRRCVVNDFKMGVRVNRASSLNAELVRVSSKKGTAGFQAYAGSVCLLKDCTAILQANPRGGDISTGFGAWFSSTMECEDCTATGWHDGFFSYHAASLDMRNCTATGNRFGGGAYLGSNLRANGCIFEESRDLGLNIHEGTASMAGCRISGSTSMAIRCYGTSMIDLRGAPCEITGSPLGIQSIAGGALNGVRPTFRGCARETEIYQFKSTDEAVFQFQQ
jgi:hypothetical protein